jgi:hypothetical protein
MAYDVGKFAAAHWAGIYGLFLIICGAGCLFIEPTALRYPAAVLTTGLGIWVWRKRAD